METPDGVTEARRYLMQCSNTMLLAMEAATYVAQQWKKRHDKDLPNEHFQGLCQTFFIQAGGFVKKMPTKPI